MPGSAGGLTYGQGWIVHFVDQFAAVVVVQSSAWSCMSGAGVQACRHDGAQNCMRVANRDVWVWYIPMHASTSKHSGAAVFVLLRENLVRVSRPC